MKNFKSVNNCISEKWFALKLKINFSFLNTYKYFLFDINSCIILFFN